MSMTTSDATRAEMTPAWEQPGDAAMFWTQDRMHFPYPISRMEDDLARLALVDGLNRAHELYDIPARLHARRFWTYHYATMVPLSLSPEEMQAMAASSEQKLGQLIGAIDTQWETVWLPAIKEHIAYFRGFDLSGASNAAMADHLEETIERLRDLWLLHFKIVTPAYLAVSLFEELYRELFDDESPLRPYQLLQGLNNKTVESGNALWRLSRIAGASQAVRDAFENLPPDRVILALEAMPGGQQFLVAFNEYLQEYGKRGETWGLNYPSWIEDPTPVIKTIRDYINNPSHDPERDHALLAEDREQLIAEARAALATYPEAVRGQFEAMLAAAQTGLVLSEDHGYWIDFQALYEVRRVFVEIGRRFVKADVASAPDDIFHLSFDEARDTLRYLPRIDRRELVASRRAEIEVYRAITPPPMLGTPMDGAPPDDPGSRTMGKFFGGPPPVSEDPDILFGAAGSSGIVRGPARVIRDIADAARLQPGDIMVTVTTAPPWTPLFGTAAAVVTDTGGVLSHCAVVAREYRIPAVVGTGVATMTIEDGQLLEVDGDRGSVRIIRDA